MYAVGRLGSYISRGVYSVSAPFHPFGGAVDIIVVEQPDGSFKSSPWYVRFGKFQGVLKTSEKVVTINVNGVEPNFHMFLDHTGEAYFLREVDGYEWESEAFSYPFPSGYETDEPSCPNRRPLKSFSCNFDSGMLTSAEQIDVSKGIARTSSQPSLMLDVVLGQSSEKEDDYREDGGTVIRLDSLERAEIAAGVLETKWSTNIVYDSSNDNASAETLSFEPSQFQSFVNDKGENDLCRTSASCEGFMEEKSEIIANISGAIDGNSVGNSHLQCQHKLEACKDKQFDGEWDDNEKNVGFPVCEIFNKEATCEGFMEEKTEVIANISGAIDGNSVGNSHLQCQHKLEACEDKQFDGEWDDNEKNVGLPVCEIFNKEAVSDSLQSLVSESAVITSDGSSEQTHQTLNLPDVGNGEVHVHAETLVRTTELVPEVNSHPMSSAPSSESSEDEQFLFSDLAEFEDLETDCVNEDLPSICTKSEKVNGLCNTNNESYLNSDKFVRENSSANMENSIEKSGIISDPINISRSHRVAGKKISWQAESLPIMRSPIAKPDSNNNSPVSHSLGTNSETFGWTSMKKDDSNEIRSNADEEQQLAHASSSREESETSGKLKNTLRNCAVEISLCKHLLYEGMGAEAACKAFDAEKLGSEKFSSLGAAVVKNDRLVVRIDGRYFPWDAAAPILLGMAAFGSEEIIEPKGMIPVDRVGKSIEGDPSKAIFPQSGRWKLWPFSLKRSKSRKAMQSAAADTRGYYAESAADFTVASDDDDDDDDDENFMTPKPVKKMIRAITPTSEQLASLNLKDGMNQITFAFCTAMLGKQQVDARIYLWKWNTRVVISDVDGTITKSDVLGQFMPLVGMDWSQTGVAHLFSAIKENGYQLLFLSARAISQAHITRQFLANLKQDGKALPDGPIVISPDGLFPSLYREVIRRAPHEFKIACLEEIKALFPSDCNPFYAGFGNRDTDEISYLKVGIPIGKIFIINPKGEVVVNRSVEAKTYSSLHALVHGMFPPTATSEQEDFNSWNFWKLSPPLIDT
ncbi:PHOSPHATIDIC ACID PHOSPHOHYDROLASE 2, phosphatidic acid phosphohydrolase 2 [Hibiscus trionum]|uniref:phosphatidate phosphatase n=1 Tax=Hibiscus trionum TaxID=183268 RepID=A0A9W7I4A0_HIBTR|nr:PHOSPHATIDIC ACID PHOSPHOHYDROLASE 2, phosphatidic acid phosphohydrolase 2 [Hibiscus trionum]